MRGTGGGPAGENFSETMSAHVALDEVAKETPTQETKRYGQQPRC